MCLDSVHEVDAAIDQGLEVGAAMSDEYENDMIRRCELFLDEGFESVDQCLAAAGITVNTIKAKCSWASDERMLIQAIKAKEGGFERLDMRVQKFRMSGLPLRLRVALAKMAATKLESTKGTEAAVSLQWLCDERGAELLHELAVPTKIDLSECKGLTSLPDGVPHLFQLLGLFSN